MAKRASRRRRPIDIGLGPMPIVSNIRLKEALSLQGYTAETFVKNVFYITSGFDLRFDLEFADIQVKKRYHLAVFKKLINRYKCIYIFFDGVFSETVLLWRFESFLWKAAGVKTLASPQGTDLYDLRISDNLLLKNALITDYPQYKYRHLANRQRLVSWSTRADFVVSGCDWVDHMYHWDDLMLNTFCIDGGENYFRAFEEDKGAAFVIFHAPNHRLTKGTKFLVAAVEALQQEGLNIKLDIAEKVSNKEVIERMKKAHIVADQFVIGWYAIFAIEALSMGKPVLCYLRDDLLDFYNKTGLLEEGEMPIISCPIDDIKLNISKLYHDAKLCRSTSGRGLEYIKKHHSLSAVGRKFASFNRRMGLLPSISSFSEKQMIVDKLQRKIFHKNEP